MEGIIALGEEGGVLVDCCSVHVTTSAAALVVCAGAGVVAAAESCTNAGYSLANELAAAELAKS